jgi:hypothetical protein
MIKVNILFLEYFCVDVHTAANIFVVASILLMLLVLILIGMSAVVVSLKFVTFLMLLVSLVQLIVIDVHGMSTVADVPSLAKPDVASVPEAVACP